MRLTKLKIAGFKSFVDPTHINFPSNLVGVVGPNGCGKSNIIDAVRWVMGEISAKHLRGDSMADVIFNGSASRKPLGNASVELVFDNAEGKLGGEYANYKEIALRRSVSRDGVSDYFINGSKVRRKDITQLFLGTGLGSRSYAIIEQGMISRIIEAKPEDLRAFLEEAAGISRYKERRRETELRITHTRENLERLNDVREEVEKQIRHLQKQAAAARRFQTLKDEARRLHAEILLLRLSSLDAEMVASDANFRQCELELQARLSALRHAEGQIEKLRQEQTARTDALTAAQGRYYDAGSAVAQVEQQIAHARELRQRHEDDVRQSDSQLLEFDRLEQRDRVGFAELEQAIARVTPELERANAGESQARESQEAVEEALARWQTDADTYAQALARAEKEAQVERTRIEQLENQTRRLQAQRERLEIEFSALRPPEESDDVSSLIRAEAQSRDEAERAAASLAEILGELAERRTEQHAQSAQLEETRARWQAAKSALIANETLQAAALGASGGAERWIDRQDLKDKPRIAQQLRVDRGWERAVETALGPYLEAVCVDDIENLAAALTSFDSGYLALITGDSPSVSVGADSLASKVHDADTVRAMLAPIRVASSLSEAFAGRHELASNESLITRDGVWVGPNWVRISRRHDPHEGMIEREETLRHLRKESAEMEDALERAQQAMTQAREELGALEARREQLQSHVNRSHGIHVEARSKMESLQAQVTERIRRSDDMEHQRRSFEEEGREAEAQLRAARERLAASVRELEQLAPRGLQLESDRDALRNGLATARQVLLAAQSSARDLAVQLEARRSAHAALLTTLARMSQQREAVATRREEAQRQLEAGESPMQEFQAVLTVALERRLTAESELRSERAAAEEAEGSLRERDSQRMSLEHQVDRSRNASQTASLEAQQVRLRREGLAEQLDATQFDRATLVEGIDSEARLEAWEERLAQTNERIERLGPVNLAAIDEFKTQAERKEYLDRQNQDLVEALELLESAMRKIERETKSRFQDTFDRVNVGLKEKFPRLFGGGHAYLELTGDDALESGVSIMARPPGKRNSSISQLSGGEKALTAAALVFSIFELNPAPFCLLDEVDAPLDENNIGRFCDVVRDMARQVQFIFITHNKGTMETASQLIGVTMSEPGVSRLVAVDVDEAVRLAAS